MECTEVVLKIKHSWQIQEMIKQRIGKIPFPIQEMYVDNEEAHFEFGSERDITISLEEENVELVVKDQKYFETALMILSHLVSSEEEVEHGILVTRFRFRSGESEMANLTTFDHLVESMSREGNQVEGLVFIQTNEEYRSKVTAFVGKAGMKLSYFTELQGSRFEKLCRSAREAFMVCSKAAEKTLPMLMKE